MTTKKDPNREHEFVEGVSESAFGEHHQGLGETLKKTVFTVLLVVIKEDQKPRHWAWTILALVIDFFQLLSFALAGGVQVPFGVAQILSEITGKFRLYSELSNSLGGYYSSLYISWFWILSILATLHYVFRSCSKGTTKYIFPFRYLRFSIGISLSVLFIPIAQVLLFILDCDYLHDIHRHFWIPNLQCWDTSHSIHSAISLLLLIVLSLILGCMTLVYFDYKPGKFTSKAHGRLDFFHLASRLILCLNVTFFHSGQSLSLLSCSILLILSASLSASTLYFLPFYNKKLNAFKAGTYVSFFWCSFCACIALATDNGLSPFALAILIYIGVPCAFSCGVLCVYFLYKKIWSNCLKGIFWNKYHLEVASRFYYEYHQEIYTAENQAVLYSLNSTEHYQTENGAEHHHSGSQSQSQQPTFPPFTKISPSDKIDQEPQTMMFQPPPTPSGKNIHSGTGGGGSTCADGGGGGGGSASSITSRYLDRHSTKLQELSDAMGKGVEILQDILRCGTIAFPGDSFVMFCHGLHSQVSFQDPISAMKLFSFVLNNKSAQVDLEFLAFRCVEEYKRGSNLGGIGAQTDVISQFELARDMKVLKRSHLQALHALADFWEALSSSSVGLQTLETALHNLHRWESEAEQSFRSVLRRTPGNPSLLRSYASFLFDVKNDPVKAMQILQEADELEDTVSHMVTQSMQEMQQPESPLPPPLPPIPSFQNSEHSEYSVGQDLSVPFEQGVEMGDGGDVEEEPVLHFTELPCSVYSQQTMTNLHQVTPHSVTFDLPSRSDVQQQQQEHHETHKKKHHHAKQKSKVQILDLPTFNSQTLLEYTQTQNDVETDEFGFPKLEHIPSAAELISAAEAEVVPQLPHTNSLPQIPADAQSRSSGGTSTSSKTLNSTISRLRVPLEMGKASNKNLSYLQLIMRIILSMGVVMNIVIMAIIVADFSTLQKYFSKWLFEESFRSGLTTLIWLSVKTISIMFSFLTNSSFKKPFSIDFSQSIADAQKTILTSAERLRTLHLDSWDHVKQNASPHRDLFTDKSISSTLCLIPFETFNSSVVFDEWSYQTAPTFNQKVNLLDLANNFVESAISTVRLNETSPIAPNSFYIRMNEDILRRGFTESMSFFLDDAFKYAERIKTVQLCFLVMAVAIFIIVLAFLFRFMLPRIEREKVETLNLVVATPKSICNTLAQRVHYSIEQEEFTGEEDENADQAAPSISEIDFAQHFPSKERTLKFERSKGQFQMVLKLFAALSLIFTGFVVYFALSFVAATEASAAATDLNWPMRSEIIHAWGLVQEIGVCEEEDWCAWSWKNLHESQQRVETLLDDFLHGKNGYRGILGRFTDVDQFLTQCGGQNCTVAGLLDPVGGYLNLSHKFNYYTLLLLAEDYHKTTLDFMEVQHLSALYGMFLTQTEHLLSMVINHVNSAFSTYILGFALTLVATFVLMGWVYFIIENQVVKKIGLELCRIDLCLLLLPQEVIELMPNLKGYLVRRAKAIQS